MRFSCSRGLLALLTACLVGCSEDPGLQERVNRLQAGAQEKDRQLQEAQAALERTKAELKSARAAASKPPPADTPAPAFLPKDQVDDGYAAASKELRRRVAGDLKNYAVEDCIEYPVTMPTDERPYRSKVVLLVRSDAGRSYRLEFPVAADAAGKWAFPSGADVAGALAESRAQDANNNNANTAAATPPRNVPANNGSGSGRPPVQSPPPPVPGQTSSETRVIDWGDGRSTNRPNRPPGEGGSPPPGRSPAPAMPSDKDVKIHW